MENGQYKDPPDIKQGMGLFERYLSIWVAVAIILGILLGQALPVIPAALTKLEIAQVSIPVALLIWAMIFPMMVQIDFAASSMSAASPRG